jgi:sugar phosphate permease
MSSLFAAGYLALLPVLSDQVFGRPRGFTTLAAVTGFGSMIGALTTGFRAKEPSFTSSTLLVAGFGASLILLGRTSSWPAALAVMVLVGIFYFSAMTSLNTLIQSLADENKRGRIMSLFVIGWAGLVPIAGLWQGAFAQRHGVQTTISVAGSVTAVYSLLVLLLRRRRRVRGAARTSVRPG